MIELSDVIMSFPNRGRQESLQWNQIFWFDTNELPSPVDESVLRAELRLFKGKAAEEFAHEKAYFVVKCYQLVEGSTGEENLLDSLEVDFRDEGESRSASKLS